MSKILVKYCILSLLISISSCETNEYVRMLKLKTSEITSFGLSSAEVSFEFIDKGDVPISEFGLCYDFNPNPEITDNKFYIGTDPEILVHKETIEGLQSGSMYFVRSYAIVDRLPIYSSNELSFTTLEINLPEVRTNTPSSVTSSSAQVGGEVLSDGNSHVYERGVCYGISIFPTTRDQTTNGGEGVGSFNNSVSGLIPGTKYYVRAYARNTKGVAYGEEVSYTTSY